MYHARIRILTKFRSVSPRRRRQIVDGCAHSFRFQFWCRRSECVSKMKRSACALARSFCRRGARPHHQHHQPLVLSVRACLCMGIAFIRSTHCLMITGRILRSLAHAISFFFFFVMVRCIPVCARQRFSLLLANATSEWNFVFGKWKSRVRYRRCRRHRRCHHLYDFQY